MNLGEAVYRRIAQHTPKREESAGAMAARAQREAGGVSQLARALGVSRTTVQRWNRGSTPTVESQELLRAVLRRADLSKAREKRLSVSNALVVTGYQGGRRRTVDLGRYLSPGTMGRAVEAYLRGASPAELHVVVWKGISGAPGYTWMFQPPAHLRPPERPEAAERGAPVGGAGPSGGGGYVAPDEWGGTEWGEDDLGDYYAEEYDYADVAEFGDVGGYELTIV
jgi:DNA-binding transcriptional regulator YiaG